MPTSWSNLSWIICRLIFKHLSLEDTRACATVCKHWHVEITAARTVAKRQAACNLAEVAFEWMRADPRLFLSGSMAVWLFQDKPTRWFPDDADLFYCAPPPLHHRNSIVSVDLPSSYTGPPITFLTRSGLRIAPVHQYDRPFCDRPLVVNVATPAAGKIQLILNAFGSPTECLESFDLSCAMLAYTHTGELIRGPRFTESAVVAYVLHKDVTHDMRPGYQHAEARDQLHKQRFRTERRIQCYLERIGVATHTVEYTDAHSPFYNIYIGANPNPRQPHHR